ncbi:MAG: hypothetical protein JWR50_1049 [Mucilaginibacter sp.]|nr:hypothetical protein [Mucilaginibacter sp.]
MRKISLFLLFITSCAYSQVKYKNIPFPAGISSVNEEFSGMALWNNRVYLEPQYGDHKETKLDGDFNIYSIAADSINRVITGKDTALSTYKTLKVLNLDKLPDSVNKYYEGFEAITFTKNQVYLSIETNDKYDYCFVLKGSVDTVNNQIRIDPYNFATLKRPLYITNAGFESVTYLPKENKLLAMYEFNAADKSNTGFLIDTAFKDPPQKIKTPFLYFRITDITATKNDELYGVNYYYNGDYNSYLDNGIVSKPETAIKQTIPTLRDSLDKTPDYLKHHTFARIVMRRNYKDLQWKQLITFDGYRNNWEGLTLFDKGALIVTDANRSSKQVSVLAYIEF